MVKRSMVTIKKGKHPSEEAWLQRRAQRHIRSLSRCRVPGAAALKKAELSLWLCGDAEIRALNKKWRGKDKATDVLSFPLVGEMELRALARMRPVPAWELGDVVISRATALRQAAEHGVTLRQELDLLLVHGLLHLLGFDHELSVEEERRMRRWERKILGRDGLL